LFYIGTLIDDLVTKGTSEPYRVMTSRSEYRLLLRQDNADERLTEIGHRVGLVSDEAYKKYKAKMALVFAEIERLERTVVAPSPRASEVLSRIGTTDITTGAKLAELLRRPEVSYNALIELDPERPTLPSSVWRTVEVRVKYAGYIKRELSEVEKQRKLEARRLPPDIDYSSILGLRLEAVEKLNKIRPENIGQASRISGVSPADISVLLIYLSAKK